MVEGVVLFLEVLFLDYARTYLRVVH